MICHCTSGRRRRGAEATKGSSYFWKCLVGFRAGFSSHEILGLRPSAISVIWGWPMDRIKGLNSICFKSEAELGWHLLVGILGNQRKLHWLTWNSVFKEWWKIKYFSAIFQQQNDNSNWWCLGLTSAPSVLLFKKLELAEKRKEMSGKSTFNWLNIGTLLLQCNWSLLLRIWWHF